MAFAVLSGGCAWLPDVGGGGLGHPARNNAASVNDGRVSFKVRGFLTVALANQSARRAGFVWRRMANDGGENNGGAFGDNPAAAADIPPRDNIRIPPLPPSKPRSGAVDIITVRNVAGIVQARMRIDNNGAQLATLSGQTRAKDAETLTAQALGVSLPLRLIGDFLGGGGDDAQIRRHLREKMRKLGWRARFGTRDADGLPLRFGADGGENSVDIVITRRQ